MSILAIAIFISCPILALPFVVIGLKKDAKHRNVYYCIIAVFMALFSYCYRPVATEDLYRHHIDTMQYKDMGMEKLSKTISRNPEQLSVLYKYVISKTGNQDLLQFFTAIISYYILFYLLDGYTKKARKGNLFGKIGIWFFTLSGFHFLLITSGIFYTLALEIFSLGVYRDYVLKKKWSSYLLYLIPVFIHTCAVLPLVVLILFKLLKSKFNLKNSLILVIVILSISFLLNVVVSSFNIPIVNELSNLYRSYFDNEEQWSGLHGSIVLITYLSRLVPVAIGYILSREKNQVSDFAMFTMVLVIALYFQTTFSIRYIHIVVLCGLPLLFESINHEKYGQFYSLMLYCLGIQQIIFQVQQTAGLGRIDGIQRIFVTNLITMLSGE